MPRVVPNTAQNLLSSVVLPLLSLLLLPVSLVAVAACILKDRIGGGHESRIATSQGHKRAPGCVMISGGRMSKGLHLARAFKRAGWKVIGVEEEGWGEYCPMRFSKAIDQFYILPPAAQSYESYSTRLIAIAQQHSVTLFIPVSGAGNSVEDARAAEEMAAETKGRCRTWIQDPETMLDLHDKDRFMALVERFGMLTPKGRMVTSTSEALAFLMEEGPKDGQGREPKYILKCMDLDDNRGDMTLYPLKGDDVGLSSTRKMLEGLRLKITKECPYVFQEFIPGQEWCTHASVLLGQVTAFVTCPSNDMLMTYENATSEVVGKQAEEWTRKLLAKLQQDPTPNGEPRRLTGHFSFDFIQSTKDGQLYPLECNARVHTAVILLPLSKLASCYDPQYQSRSEETLRPNPKTAPRSWIYNDLIMRYLPLLVPSHDLLSYIHASLPASAVVKRGIRPSEEPVNWRVDPSLIADDWIPFIVLWHVFWPIMLLTRWWQGKKWTRLNVSTGRIFEA